MVPKSLLPLTARFRSRLRRFDFGFVWIAGAIALVLVSIVFVSAQSQKAQAHGKSASGGDVTRGKYLVENVARCEQCHTPRDYNGNPDHSHALQGAAVPFNPPKPDPNWPQTAPRIGGTPLPASDEDMIKLLTTGIWTNGTYLRSPMPQFRLERADAEAVVAYLKSVNAQPE